MTSTFSNVFSTEDIDSILNMSDVINARTQLLNGKNNVSFTIHLSESLKQNLLDTMGLNLMTVADVPMRWIRGDTAQHADVGAHQFDNTYLMYLTDSVGALIVDGQSYPIAKGAGYVFPEGLMHGSSNTGAEPRLLLGPMSNTGISVGTITTISVPGASIIHVRQGTYDVEYSLDQIDWYAIYWPCSIENTLTSSGYVTITFDTDIILTNQNSYFICLTSYLRFGNIALRPDWTRAKITIDSVFNYPGLIQSGDIYSNGHANYVVNLTIEAINGSTLAEEGGWIAQAHYGGNASPNFIVNCHTSAPIGNNCGGITGSNLAKNGGWVQIVGCYTTGNIGDNAGGIVGIRAGENGGYVEVLRCSSTGTIGDSGGGIAGAYCGGHSATVSIYNCYSTGVISYRAGGIVGIYCGNDGTNDNLGTINIYRCYSNGAIGEDAGGIVATTPGGYMTVTNCFSSGAISNAGFAGGIYGRYFNFNLQSAHHCYTSGLKDGIVSGGIYGESGSDVLTNSSNNYSEENNSGISWSDVQAKQVLLGTPTNTMYGTHWCQPDGIQTPFKLSVSAFSPYSVYSLTENDTVTQTITSGENALTPAGNGYTYKLLQVDNKMPYNVSEISIDADSGVISTAFSKETKTYNIYIYSTINPYAVTWLILTVNASGEKECYNRSLCTRPGKKFVGGNRDSSAVIHRKTANTIANLKTIDPKQKSDAVNVQNRNDALTRVRGGGYMVPKKVTGKYLL